MVIILILKNIPNKETEFREVQSQAWGPPALSGRAGVRTPEPSDSRKSYLQGRYSASICLIEVFIKSKIYFAYLSFTESFWTQKLSDNYVCVWVEYIFQISVNNTLYQINQIQHVKQHLVIFTKHIISPTASV